MCRRCDVAPRFTSYSLLRAHLRAQHRIVQLPNSEVGMYEAYPGSRFTQPPFNAGPSHGNVDQMIEIRDSMVRAVSESIAQGFSSQPAPIISVNMGPVVERIVQMQTELVAAVSQNIETGVRNAIGDLAAQLRSIPSTTPAITMGTSIEAIAQVTDDQPGENVEAEPAQTNADGPITPPSDAVVNLPAIDTKRNDPVMIGNTVNVLAGMPSLVRRTPKPKPPIVPNEAIADIEDIVGDMPSAQSTQKPPVVQGPSLTTSDDELMAVELPEDSVTVSQIIKELRSEVRIHLAINSVALSNTHVTFNRSRVVHQCRTPIHRSIPAKAHRRSLSMLQIHRETMTSPLKLSNQPVQL